MFHVGPTFFSAEAAPVVIPTVITPGTPGLLGSVVGLPIKVFPISSTSSALWYQSNTTGKQHLALITNNGTTASLGTNYNLGDAYFVHLTGSTFLVLDNGGVVSTVPGYLRGYTVTLSPFSLGTEYVLENTTTGNVVNAFALTDSKVIVCFATGTLETIVVDIAGTVLSTDNAFTEVDTVDGALGAISSNSNAVVVLQGIGLAVSGRAITVSGTTYPVTYAYQNEFVQMTAAGAFAIFQSDVTGDPLYATRAALSGTVTTYSASNDQAAEMIGNFSTQCSFFRANDNTIVRLVAPSVEDDYLHAQTHGFTGDINPASGEEQISNEPTSYPRGCRLTDSLTLMTWNVLATNRIGYALAALS